MRRWIGRSLLGIAVVHTVLGAVFHGSTVATLVREGLIATVQAQPSRNAVFWFFYFGFAMALVGAWIDELEAQGRRLPGYLVWGLVALTLVGVAMMPASGFWLLVPPVAGAVARNRRLETAGAGTRASARV